MEGEENSDPRTNRTHEAILAAFRQLALERRYDAIRVTDLIAAAGIGRATLYEHFRGKDDVLLAAMEPILIPLANAAAGRPAQAHVRATLDHIWQQRSIGRVILDSSAGKKVQRRLTAMIVSRLDGGTPGSASASIGAAGAAAAQLAMLRMWIAGEAASRSDALADRMLACARIAQPPAFAR